MDNAGLWFYKTRERKKAVIPEKKNRLILISNQEDGRRINVA